MTSEIARVQDSRATGEDGWPVQGFRHKQLQPVIVYVDTRALSRESIGRWLAKHLSGFFIRTEPDDAGAAAFAAANERTAVVLKHFGSASATSGEVAASLTEFVRLVTVPVAVFADSEEVDVVTAALDCGVRGYIPTSLKSAVVVQALRLIYAGDIYAPVACLLGQQLRPQSGIRPAVARPAVPGFSERQHQIIDCLRQGMANKHVAHALGLSEATVKVHVRNIMKKLRATNRTQVVLKTMSLFDHRSQIVS